jgi:hypothetical protein
LVIALANFRLRFEEVAAQTFLLLLQLDFDLYLKEPLEKSAHLGRKFGQVRRHFPTFADFWSDLSKTGDIQATEMSAICTEPIENEVEIQSSLTWLQSLEI